MRHSDLTGRSVPGEVDDLLAPWRSRAVSIMLGLAGVAALPPLLIILHSRIFRLSWPLQVVCVLLVLAIWVTALRPRWNYQWRTAVMLAVLAVFGVIQLAVTHLEGDGKISLLILPIIASIIVGPRLAWGMAILGCTLFALTAFVILTETVPGMIPADGLSAAPGFWLLQGLRLTTHMIVLTFLLTQFHALQRRTMIAERTTLMKLEAETASRKRLEAEIARISEEEQRKLGFELHDGLCQSLTGALLNCASVENRLDATSSPAAREISRIREEIEASMDMAYNAARGLCPVDLDRAGLIPALEDLCRSMRERRGMACRLQVNGAVAVSDQDCALQLYRIAGEALANAARHSAGTQAVVRIDHNPDGLVLTVTDNGRGLDGDSAEGLGLKIMAYRAELINGSFSISSKPGKGTEVTCRIPEPAGGGEATA